MRVIGVEEAFENEGAFIAGVVVEVVDADIERRGDVRVRRRDKKEKKKKKLVFYTNNTLIKGLLNLMKMIVVPPSSPQQTQESSEIHYVPRLHSHEHSLQSVCMQKGCC